MVSRWPLKTYKKDGIICFTHDMENENIYVDKVGSEDSITLHEAEFEITEGY